MIDLVTGIQPENLEGTDLKLKYFMLPNEWFFQLEPFQLDKISQGQLIQDKQNTNIKTEYIKIKYIRLCDHKEHLNS